MLSGMLGDLWWPLDLFSHFRLQYSIGIVACLLAFALCRACRRTIIAAALGAYCLLTLGTLLRIDTTQPAYGTYLDLVHANVLVGNPNTRTLIDELTAGDPDIVGLQEINAEWLRALEATDGYEVVFARSREDSFGIALLALKNAHVTVSEARELQPGQPHTVAPAIEATLTLEGQRVRLLYMHTFPPMNPRYARARETMLDWASEWVHKQDDPTIVLGDLNATVWSAPYKRLLAETGLHNPGGVRGTWPTRLPPPMRIRIDHCLHDPLLHTTRYELLPAHGADHRPLRVRIGW